MARKPQKSTEIEWQDVKEERENWLVLHTIGSKAGNTTTTTNTLVECLLQVCLVITQFNHIINGQAGISDMGSASVVLG